MTRGTRQPDPDPDFAASKLCITLHPSAEFSKQMKCSRLYQVLSHSAKQQWFNTLLFPCLLISLVLFSQVWMFAMLLAAHYALPRKTVMILLLFLLWLKIPFWNEGTFTLGAGVGGHTLNPSCLESASVKKFQKAWICGHKCACSQKNLEQIFQSNVVPDHKQAQHPCRTLCCFFSHTAWTLIALPITYFITHTHNLSPVTEAIHAENYHQGNVGNL